MADPGQYQAAKTAFARLGFQGSDDKAHTFGPQQHEQLHQRIVQGTTFGNGVASEHNKFLILNDQEIGHCRVLMDNRFTSRVLVTKEPVQSTSFSVRFACQAGVGAVALTRLVEPERRLSVLSRQDPTVKEFEFHPIAPDPAQTDLETYVTAVLDSATQIAGVLKAAGEDRILTSAVDGIEYIAVGEIIDRLSPLNEFLGDMKNLANRMYCAVQAGRNKIAFDPNIQAAISAIQLRPPGA